MESTMNDVIIPSTTSSLRLPWSRPVKFELIEQTCETVDAYLKATARRSSGSRVARVPIGI
jgi:hypothetical protein